MEPAQNTISTLYDIFAKLKNDASHTFSFFALDPGSLRTVEKKRSFAEVHEDIQLCYNHLSRLGINAQSTVVLNITNQYGFFACDFALILLGATTVLHSKNDSLTLLKERIEIFNARCLISEKQVPEVQDICRVVELDSLFIPGAPPVEVKPHELTDRDISIVFSSGTSGLPKGLGVSERGSIETGKVFFDWMEFNQNDCFLIYLPLASYQQRFLMWSCLIKNVDIVLADDKTLFQALETFKPTILIAPPNFYFNLYRLNTGSRFKQTIRKLLPYNYRSKILKFIAGAYSYEPLYKILGGRTRYLITGMAPIDIKILQHFKKGYLDIYQIYGQTEIGMIVGNKVGANKIGTVGKPIIKITLSDDGEIITHSDFPTMNSSYPDNLNRVELGKRIPTGDIGVIDEDGYVTIRGRKNETIILKSGIKINPVLIENKIKAKIHIDEVVIFKSDAPGMRSGLNVVLLVKSLDTGIEMGKITGTILDDPEIRQSSEPVAILAYTVKDEDKKIMYTENNKLSRVRTIELLKKNYGVLQPIGREK